MSTPFLATAALAATSIVSLAGLPPPAAAAAQGGEDWFFCYAESPTYGSGTYVYTRTQYAGANAVPKGEIATAIAREVPQAQGRDVTCWRYPTQAIAEQKRTQGMTMDKGRGYTVHVLNWSSPYTYVPAPVAPAPVAEVDELAPADTVPTVAVTAAPDAPLPAAMATTAPAPVADPAPVAAPAAPEAPKPRTLTYDEEFALKKAEWQRQVDENARQQAAYAIQLAAEQQRAMEAAAAVEDARRDYERQLEQQRAQYEAEQAAWKADVAACEAGQVERCAKPEAPAETDADAE